MSRQGRRCAFATLDPSPRGQAPGRAKAVGSRLNHARPDTWPVEDRGRQRIDDNMKYRSCAIVLIGEDTSKRSWVKYEIKKAWNDGKGLFGIYIHNLKHPTTGTCTQGANPFTQFSFNKKNGTVAVIPVYSPSTSDAYGDIKKNIDKWAEDAIKIKDDRLALA